MQSYALINERTATPTSQSFQQSQSVLLIMSPSQSPAALGALIPADTKAQWSGIARVAISQECWIRTFLNHFLLSPCARDYVRLFNYLHLLG